MMGPKAQPLPTLTSLGLLKSLSHNTSLQKSRLGQETRGPARIGRAPWGLSESN